MHTLIDDSLTKELLNVLKVLLVDDFGQHSQSVGLEYIIIGLLDILGEAADDHEHVVFVDVELLDEYVYQSSQVRVKFVPLTLWDLE